MTTPGYDFSERRGGNSAAPLAMADPLVALPVLPGRRRLGRVRHPLGEQEPRRSTCRAGLCVHPGQPEFPSHRRIPCTLIAARRCFPLADFSSRGTLAAPGDRNHLHRDRVLAAWSLSHVESVLAVPRGRL